MPDLGVISDVVGLGVGAVIALIVLFWKRGDDQRYQKALEDMEIQHQTEMKAIIERMDRRDSENRAVIEANTSALTGIKVAIDMVTKTIEGMASLRVIEEQVRELAAQVGKKP